MYKFKNTINKEFEMIFILFHTYMDMAGIIHTFIMYLYVLTIIYIVHVHVVQ